jgi:hypothetical protein
MHQSYQYLLRFDYEYPGFSQLFTLHNTQTKEVTGSYSVCLACEKVSALFACLLLACLLVQSAKTVYRPVVLSFANHTRCYRDRRGRP